MSAVDLAIAEFGIEIESAIYSGLKDFEVECIMCDWNIYIAQKQIYTARLQDRTNYLYIDLTKDKLVWSRDIKRGMSVWYQIERVRGTMLYPIMYTVRNVHKSKSEHEGSMIDCIEHFRKKLL